MCPLCTGVSQDVLHEDNGEDCCCNVDRPQQAPQQQGGMRSNPTMPMPMGHWLIGQGQR